MKFNFVTIHPNFMASYSEFGVFSSALKNSLAQIKQINLRDYATDKHGTVDDSPYGGGDGMVMKPDILASAVQEIENRYVVFTGPSGKKFSQKDAKDLFDVAKSGKEITFVCGRFGGVDQRFMDQYVDVEYSLGDFVISGGELPSLMICDSILRFIPGVLGNSESYEQDSFSEAYEGGLEYPQYTKPREFEGIEVPEVLLSGNHKAIEDWRKDQSLSKTKSLRPDLFKK
jgi:tRNA (guanine37-N1)-methyltransferase